MGSRYPVIRSLRRLAILTCVSSALLFAQKPVVRIGSVMDGPAESNEMVHAAFEEEIRTLLDEEYDVQFPADKQLVADWTAAGNQAAVDRLLADSEVDQVLALGIITSQIIGTKGSLPKPCYGAFVVDPAIQELPVSTIERSVSETETESITVSGVENLNYTVMGIDTPEEFRSFREIVPHDHVTVLYTSVFRVIFPEIEQRIQEMLRLLGYERFAVVPAGTSVDEALAAIPQEAEAVYVSTLPQFGRQDMERLAKALIDRKLPSFSQTGRPEVELGLLASLGQAETYVRRARRVALNMQQVLGGAPASELTVEFERRESLVINMATARAIGVSPSFRILTVAELLHEERTDVQRQLSLSGVVKEAEQVNLDLAVADRAVAAGREFVKQLRSPLLPQVGISGGGTFIDKDRAALGAGQNPQHLASGTLSASQVLYDEELKGTWDAGKTDQQALEQSRNAIRLDVIGDAATSYLGVLRAKTIERIQKDNLKLTRSNLGLAQVRVEIGQAGRDEVYRWQSQLSNNQRSVIDANAFRNVSEIQVNQVLNRPIEEPFVTAEVGLDDPELATSFEQLRPYVASPAAFDIYRNFMTAEAFAQSPEVREFEYLVRSNQRIVKLSKRAYYIPSIQASAGGTYLGRFKEGSTAPPPPLDSFFTNPYNWQVSITGSYDIFNGGFRESRLSRAREELRQLETRLAAARQRVEQRVRSELHLAGASFVGIDLSLDAARAARQNLELVQASYAEGVVDILRLLDAQNWALNADLASANATFNHLSDLMRVQRAVGKFDYYRSPEDRQEFLNRLDEFFQNAGYEVKK